MRNPPYIKGFNSGWKLIRSYLGESKPKNLGRVVILGSPNKGTPVVEMYKDKWYFCLAGPAAKSLSSLGSKFLTSLKKPDYPLGVIAGVHKNSRYSSVLKGQDDGLVSVDSAKVEGMTDFIIVESSHTWLRNSIEASQQTINFLKHEEFIKAKHNLTYRHKNQ